MGADLQGKVWVLAVVGSVAFRTHKVQILNLPHNVGWPLKVPQSVAQQSLVFSLLGYFTGVVSGSYKME